MTLMDYGSFCLFVGLSIWSLGSPRQRDSHGQRHRALLLLAASACIRLAGQVLAIHVIGALALVVDSYALGLLLGLAQRRRPLSPFWLSVLFACALPVERILQRTLGYALQQLSAGSACALLTRVDARIVCHGTRIQLPNTSLLIDLPCSGASALVLLLVLLATLLAVARPRWQHAIPALVSVLVGAWLSNSLRILLLAVGVIHPLAGIDVMRQPWHEFVGLLALLPACALLLWLFVRIHRTTRAATPTPPLVGSAEEQKAKRPKRAIIQTQPARILLAFAFLLLALVVVTRTPQPLDAGQRLSRPYAPRYLAGEYGHPLPLLPKEQAYFEQFGGAATKMQYGERGLLITHTESPLRHLYAPDECLRGLGFEMEYLGTHAQVLPTAVYRARSPDGALWKVTVSFIAADGRTASNVAEAVWYWLQAPQPWFAVQRIVPWGRTAAADHEWDRQLFAALDYPVGP